MTTMSNILLTRSKNGNAVFNPSFSVTKCIARHYFGDFSLTQHRNRRKHPPTYLAEPHQGADSRTFAAPFWRFSQGHEHSPALILVKRVLNSASQCERSRRVWQAIEREGKASQQQHLTTPAFGQPLSRPHQLFPPPTRSVATLLLLYTCRPAARSRLYRRLLPSLACCASEFHLT
jgi:hypothetical protein